MSKGKKIALIVSMVLVLAVAAVLNVTLLANQNKQPSGETVQTGFFETSRTDRQATRNYEIAELNAILALEGEEYAEARQRALEQKQNIVDAMETELLLETLLKAQGFDDVLVGYSYSSPTYNLTLNLNAIDDVLGDAVVHIDHDVNSDLSSLYGDITLLNVTGVTAKGKFNIYLVSSVDGEAKLLTTQTSLF